ncbi:unnamed protein product [Kuraishia capsulata CBS 1993]|uniref:Zinc-hook domain-containing protein n=1 Tax=Kuraishia capsulata CBS 1993 TaxID=1382522 RepID=W6MS79_9ASCO|nr:uncharacterized protein KUCA_T00004043001 [Kuraishia capsulata CBS 1993]CDK28062.1 unnamed protein product [Kuraishia capsulata CBS 1993]
MILSKSLQLVLKSNNSSTFKTLENQLVAINKGERTTVSQKANEVEQLLPNLLGTSKAILNYVIFCHQDDSLWPISEASVLKKRFDEIFDSVKFIKVLDNFKAINKDMALDIKLLNNNVGHLSNDKKRASEKKNTLAAVENTILQYNSEIEQMSNELQVLDAEAERLFSSNQDFEKVLSELDSLKQRLTSLREQEDRLEASITVLTDSDAKLEESLGNFTETLSQKNKELEQTRAALESLNSKLQTEQRRLNGLVREEGELVTLTTQYQSNLEKRLQIQHQFDGELGDQGFEINFEKKVEDLSKYIKTEEPKYEQQNEKLQHEIRQLRDQVSTEAEHAKYMKADISSLTTKNQSMTRAIEGMEVNTTKLVVEKALLEKLLEKLTASKSNNKADVLAKSIEQRELTILDAESSIESLNKSISQASMHGAVMAKVELLNESKQSDIAMIQALKDENADLFKLRTGHDLEASACKEQWETAFEGLKSRKDNVLNTHEQIARENTKIQDEYSRLTTELKDYQSKTRDSQRFVFKFITKEELPNFSKILEDRQVEYDQAMEVYESAKAALRINEGAIRKTKADRICPTCRRGFDTEAIFDTILETLAKAGEGLKAIIMKSQIEEIRTELANLRSISADVSEVRIMSETTDRMKTEIKAAEDALNKKTSELHRSELELKDATNALLDMEHLREAVGQMNRLMTDINQKENELHAVKEQMSSSGLQSETIEELESLRRTKMYECKALREELKDLLYTKERVQNAQSALEKEVSDKRLVISELERKSLQSVNLRKIVEENVLKIREYTETVAVSETKQKELKEALIAASDEQEAFTRKKTLELNELKAELSKLSAKLNEWHNLKAAIMQYEEHDILRLQNCQSKIADTKSTIARLNHEISDCDSLTRTMERDLSETDNLKRNLRLNLDLRSIRKQIAATESRLEKLDTQNALVMRDEYVKKSEVLRQKFSDLKSVHSQKIGEVSQMQKNAQLLRNELERDYNKIGERHKEEFTRLQTKMLLSNDITIYSKALDNAVMKYHSLKMKEINKIIDELWKKTYSGTDVDTILIKSDMASSQVKSAGRSYNYRVVMVKQDTELDMRGRCSAGQKVLASIIIRLALAESFGVNCGIIALDEPTTNLDEPNIESLARSLNQLIENRQSQNNFQLIVITHDEKFLTHMKAAQFTDHYYRVSRNERQKSEIGLININSS